MPSLTLLLLLTPLALAVPQEEDATATASGYDLPSSASAADVLYGLYGSNIPTAATGAVATSLASALYSYEMSMYDDPAYKSAANAVYMAMATASDADEIFASFDGSGAVHADFTTAAWFKTGVPEDAQTAIASYWDAMSAVETSVLGVASATATATGSAESTPTETATDAATSEGAVSSSPSSGGAPAATGMVMAGLAAGVAMGVFAAV